MIVSGVQDFRHHLLLQARDQREPDEGGDPEPGALQLDHSGFDRNICTAIGWFS